MEMEKRDGFLLKLTLFFNESMNQLMVYEVIYHGIK